MDSGGLNEKLDSRKQRKQKHTKSLPNAKLNGFVVISLNNQWYGSVDEIFDGSFDDDRNKSAADVVDWNVAPECSAFTWIFALLLLTPNLNQKCQNKTQNNDDRNRKKMSKGRKGRNKQKKTIDYFFISILSIRI